MVYIPDRGHVIRLTFDPQAGHDQPGRRPAVVLGSAACNRRIGLLTRLSRHIPGQGHPFEVALPRTPPSAASFFPTRSRAPTGGLGKPRSYASCQSRPSPASLRSSSRSSRPIDSWPEPDGALQRTRSRSRSPLSLVPSDR